MDPLTFDLDEVPVPACGVTRLQVRRLHAGELPKEEHARILAHTESCLDCQTVIADLRSDDAAFRTHVKWDKFVTGHQKRLERGEQDDGNGLAAMWKWLIGGGAVLCAAATVMLVMVKPAGDGDIGERLKGKDVGIGFVMRSGEGVRIGHAGEQLKEGDEIQFFVRAPSEEQGLVVLGIDGRGDIMVYHAGNPPAGASAKAVPLSNRVMLDDAVGTERFFAVAGADQQSAEAAARKLVETRADLSQVEALPLDEKVKQDSVFIVKVAR